MHKLLTSLDADIIFQEKWQTKEIVWLICRNLLITFSVKSLNCVLQSGTMAPYWTEETIVVINKEAMFLSLDALKEFDTYLEISILTNHESQNIMWTWLLFFPFFFATKKVVKNQTINIASV